MFIWVDKFKNDYIVSCYGSINEESNIYGSQ